jgi:hypothetical protein
MKTFLGLLNPDADWVGLAVLPPATSTGNRCRTPHTATYDSTSAAYTLVPLSHDYSTNGVLNNARSGQPDCEFPLCPAVSSRTASRRLSGRGR